MSSTVAVVAAVSEVDRVATDVDAQRLTGEDYRCILHLWGVRVDIAFATHRLAAASFGHSEATRLFGVPIGRKYMQRLAVLRAADTFSELYFHRALRLHPLKGNREGQHAMTLTGNYRLIVERLSEDEVRVLDVEDYHGD